MRTTCTDLQWYPASNIALFSYCAILHNWHNSTFLSTNMKVVPRWYQDSLNQCSMLINADKNPGIDPKYLCWSALGSMPQFWSALGNDPGSRVICMLIIIRGSPFRHIFCWTRLYFLVQPGCLWPAYLWHFSSGIETAMFVPVSVLALPSPGLCMWSCVWPSYIKKPHHVKFVFFLNQKKTWWWLP